MLVIIPIKFLIYADTTIPELSAEIFDEIKFQTMRFIVYFSFYYIIFAN